MRYKERPLQLIDLVGRFEAKSSADHCYNAIAALQRLRDDGRDYWKSDPEALKRWNGGCDVLEGFLNNLGTRTKQPLATVMREFVQEFEYSIGRMYGIEVVVYPLSPGEGKLLTCKKQGGIICRDCRRDFSVKTDTLRGSILSNPDWGTSRPAFRRSWSSWGSPIRVRTGKQRHGRMSPLPGCRSKSHDQ